MTPQRDKLTAPEGNTTQSSNEEDVIMEEAKEEPKEINRSKEENAVERNPATIPSGAEATTTTETPPEPQVDTDVKKTFDDAKVALKLGVSNTETPSETREDMKVTQAPGNDKVALKSVLKSTDAPPESLEDTNVTPTSSADKAALKSVLKNTYRDVAMQNAHLPQPAPLIPKWEAHRFACMFDIKMPKDRSKRTEYLSTELNKMIDCLREYEKVYVRKYSKFHMPRDLDKTSWISKFDKKKVSDLTSYTFGFYYFQALRDGTFQLLVQLILPVGTNIPELLINVNGHRWAGKNNRSIRDIREQNLHAPKYVGWLFRSNYSMVGSNELQTAFKKEQEFILVSHSNQYHYTIRERITRILR